MCREAEASTLLTAKGLESKTLRYSIKKEVLAVLLRGSAFKKQIFIAADKIFRRN